MHAYDAIDNILADTSPRQCAEILLIVELDCLAAALHQGISHSLILNREKELIRHYRSTSLSLKSCLNQFSLISFSVKKCCRLIVLFM